jgi:hypothetical protein
MSVRKCDRVGCEADHYFAVEPISVGATGKGASSYRKVAEQCFGRDKVKTIALPVEVFETEGQVVYVSVGGMSIGFLSREFFGAQAKAGYRMPAERPVNAGERSWL